MKQFCYLAASLLFTGVASSIFGQSTSTVSIQAIDLQGAVVPGATVTLTSPGGGAPRTAKTNDEGSARFNDVPTDSRAYSLTVASSGFADNTRPVTINSPNTTLNIVLSTGAATIDESKITALTDGAAQLNIWVKGSNPDPGSIGVVYGNNIGPTTLTSNSLPLADSINGYKFSFQQQGKSSIALPIYASTVQSAFLIPSVASNGQAGFSVSSPKGESKSYAAQLGGAPPQAFTLTADGQGFAVATHQDGRVVTVVDPGAPGEVLTVYMSRTGRRQDDTQFSVADLRSEVTDLSVVLDGKTVSNSDIPYIGTSGVGYGQMNLIVPKGTRSDCALPFHTFYSDYKVYSNSNLLPISKGGTCADLHGLGPILGTLANPGGLTLGSANVTEATSYSMDYKNKRVLSASRTFEWSFFAGRYGVDNYFPFPPSGGCTREYRPAGFGSTARPVTLSGTMTFTLGNIAQETLSTTTGLSKVYSPPILPSGDILFTTKGSLKVDGKDFNSTWTTSFNRDGPFNTILNQLIENRTPDMFTNDFVKLMAPQVAQAARSTTRDSFVVFRTVRDYGDLGLFSVSCGATFKELQEKINFAADVASLYQDNLRAQQVTISSMEPNRILHLLTIIQSLSQQRRESAIDVFNGSVTTLRQEHRWFSR